MIKTQYIRLDMTPGGTPPVLFCSQYDVGRPLGMVVYNGGEAVDLSAYTCTIEATRTDGTAVTAAVTTDGNVSAFATTATMTNVADRYPAKMVIVDGDGNRVASLAFVMCVAPATMDENAESIEEDQSLYQQYTGTVQTLIATERQQRQSADSALQSNINSEASARAAGDSNLSAAINEEKSARQTADSTMSAQIAQIVSTGGAVDIQHGYTNVSVDATASAEFSVTFGHTFSATPNVVCTIRHGSEGTKQIVKIKTITTTGFTGSVYNYYSTTANLQVEWIAVTGLSDVNAEITDARVGADGVTYPSLGNAIRGQVTDLKDALDALQNTYLKKYLVQLYNSADSTAGQYINSNGSIASSSNWTVTDYMPVNATDWFVYQGLESVSNIYLFYDVQKNKLTDRPYPSTGVNTLDVPVGAAYVRFSVRVSDVNTFKLYRISDLATAETADAINDTAEEALLTATVAYDGMDKQAIRKRYGMAWHNYDLPDTFSSDYFPINILSDGTDFSHDFNASDHKNTGGTTYYVSPNGTGSGLYYSNPGKIQTLFNAGSLVDGDTIVMLDGVYRDMALLSSSGKNKVTKSINLIAEHTGKATIANIGTELTWTTTGYVDVYSTTRSNTVKVAQLLDADRFVTTEYKKVASLSDCVATVGSWYLDGSTLYVHTVNHITPTYQTVFALLNYSIPVIDIDCAEQNIVLYLEGINFLGGTPCTVKFANSAAHTRPVLYAKDCNFLHGYSSSLAYDAVSVLGGDAYFENCRAEYSSKDGFNYHASNGRVPHFIEIDCVGANNGLDGVADGNYYQNGSTAHDGAQGIRIGGVYYNNNGANVADVNANTETINLMCKAFDSAAETEDKYNADFCVQQTGASMVLINCMGFGSKYSAYCVLDGTMEIKRCDFETVLHDSSN